MNNYSSHKETNIPWIGDIPTGWSTKPLKHIFSEKKSTKNPGVSSGSISFGKVIYKDDEKIPVSTKESYQEVLDGEFLINPLNLNYDLKSLRIGLSRINVVVSQGYIVLKINDGFIPEYYEYLLRKFDVEHMKSLGQGVRQTISFTHIKDEKLVVPPLEEQKLISRYLDKKTEQIDRLVEKIRKKIELLKEQRTSLINQCVTKGLDPNVEVKDSGVKWIGEIPKHWKTTKLKFESSQIVDGTHFTPRYTETGVPFLRVTDITSSSISLEKLKYISTEEHRKLIKRCNPRKGDMLLSKNGTIGKTKVIDWDWEFSIFVSLCLIRLKRTYSPNLLSLFFESNLFDTQIKDSSKQSTVTNLHLEKIREFVLIKPPIKEQENIVTETYKKIRPLEKIVKLEEQRVERFHEYRQSLISSVVTGKVRVTEDMV